MSNKYAGLMKTLDSLLSLVDDVELINELAEDILQLDERLMAVEYALGLNQPQSGDTEELIAITDTDIQNGATHS